MVIRNYKNNTSMLDLFLLLALGYAVLFILAFILIKPPVPNTEDVPLEEELYIKLTWDDELDTDVDLWVMSPSGDIVSFKTPFKSGIALERDDRGFMEETVILNGEETILLDNTEIVRIKKLEDGEYLVNVQYYSSRSCWVTECKFQKFQVDVYDGVKHKPLARYMGEAQLWAEVPVLKIVVVDGKIVEYGEHHKKYAIKNAGSYQ